MWYTAHAVLVALFKSGSQNQFPVWENIYLIWARSDRDAFSKAEKKAKAEQGDSSGSFKWNGRPAEWKYKGIRQLTKCELRSTKNLAIEHESIEISHNEFILVGTKTLSGFCRGDQLKLKALE